ncbi:MAG: [acyl-carrier-protein] S-malonyltransferase [Rickettsiales bacterium]|jgi:[acyl-carrier-protein] S-malonyltransferase
MSKQTTAIVFPGQGSQIVGMGKDLFENFNTAKEVFNEVDDILSLNLSQIIFEGPAEDLTRTQNTQPALMAVSIALTQVMEKEFGKKIGDLCSFVAGHSLGEYSALCASGSISLAQTAKLLQIRGNSMAACGEKTEGSMAAILGVEIDIAKEIVAAAAQDEICQIANDNSIGQIVISGSKSAILRAIEIAKSKGAKRAIELPVSGAFHSALMADAQIKMKEALSETEFKAPQIPLIANVKASEVSNPEEIKDLLTSQITGSVRWRETMLYLQNKGVKEVIEIGSGKVLSGLVSRTCKEMTGKSIRNLEDIKVFCS